MVGKCSPLWRHDVTGRCPSIFQSIHLAGDWGSPAYSLILLVRISWNIYPTFGQFLRLACCSHEHTRAAWASDLWWNASDAGNLIRKRIHDDWFISIGTSHICNQPQKHHCFQWLLPSTVFFFLAACPVPLVRHEDQSAPRGALLRWIPAGDTKKTHAGPHAHRDKSDHKD